MVKTLKLLIDTFFIFLCFGLLGFFFILPFGIFSTKVADIEVNTFEQLTSLPLFYWFGIILSIITYILFLIGLNYLRKTTNHFIRSSFYGIEITHNLRRSGLFFIISAIVLSIAYIMVWLIDASSGTIKLTLSTNVMIPLFLCIIGLFFILQSKILDQARLFKEDNELTI